MLPVSTWKFRKGSLRGEMGAIRRRRFAKSSQLLKISMICIRFRWLIPTRNYHRFTNHLGRKWDANLSPLAVKVTRDLYRIKCACQKAVIIRSALDTQDSAQRRGERSREIPEIRDKSWLIFAALEPRFKKPLALSSIQSLPKKSWSPCQEA